MRTIAGLLFAWHSALGLPPGGERGGALAGGPGQHSRDDLRPDRRPSATTTATPPMVSPRRTIQGLFPTADQFMSMVRNAYKPVYRPQSVTFGQLGDSPNGPVCKRSSWSARTAKATSPSTRCSASRTAPGGSMAARFVEDSGATI